MEYREIAPQPALRPYVRAIWTLCGKSDAPSFDLVLPDGFAEIVIHRTGRFREWRGPGDVRSQPLAVVAPVMDRAVALSPAASFETVGVRLWPCGLAHACEAPLRSFGEKPTR